jgi:hypothetical protein
MSLNKLIFMQWMPPDSAESAKGIKDIDKCNTILCLFSRNMIDKTMCEVL